ncbi:hypothetical protein Psal006b_01912 [Piscirickettsia salmonis]|uniref:Uncharacterized protein n=1 Tax=Piscirickettsia salmonis TaxID=1238 RepID=A0A1L6TB14_PISSA|nr:hypothetical protein [Piscirickettsia salmonis]AKP73695.1 hypothetical protein PSLF89_1890 [Piscirickettsia salmonis LF-89 = ATCC VR-1361]ALB22483.1 hypothetical protein KU39_1301 [Piscirickettsia salmonis]AMA42063.1 hypothetical protein AWJ11_06525 [Piscirickettsia salmonis]AOS34531.1 hypothetical protein AVM72_03685 [Piscirickettsia salmonis]APS59251.1 hypothetical protein AVI53_00610 [Piscirickettsia salmonis]
MKFIKLKQKFILVLQLVDGLSGRGATKHQGKARSTEDKKDLVSEVEKILSVGFLEGLSAVVTDSGRSKQAEVLTRTRENIASLLEDSEVKEKLGLLTTAKIAHFEVVYKYLLGEEGEELDALVQALFAQKSTNSQEIDFCRYEAVEGLNSHFELKANIRPRKEFFVKFYHEMKRANSEISDAKETIEEINKKKSAADSSARRKTNLVTSQSDVLTSIATLYIQGDRERGLKSHSESYFNKIFGPYLEFNGGSPVIAPGYSLVDGNSDFEQILAGIVDNCQRKRTFWARVWGKLQAGKISALLLEAADKDCSKTALKINSGNVRAREAFSSNWIGNKPSECQAEAKALLDEFNRDKHLLKILPKTIEAGEAKKAKLLDDFARKVADYGKELKSAFNAIRSFRLLVQKAEKKGAAVGGLDSQVKDAEGGEKPQQATFLQKELQLTGERKVDGAIIVKHIEGIADNEQLLSLYDKLKEKEYLIKGNLLRIFSHFRTTMSGEAVKCSETWHTIEAAFTNRVRSNHQAMDGSEQGWTQLVTNYPFLRNHMQAQIVAASDVLLFRPALEQSTEVSPEELSCMAHL